MKLTVLGPGCWGLTLAWLMNDNFEKITVWGRESDLNEDLVINKHCSKPLEVQLDKKVEISIDKSCVGDTYGSVSCPYILKCDDCNNDPTIIN